LATVAVNYQITYRKDLWFTN